MKVTAYLKETCGWSAGVREVLSRYNIPYETKLINDADNYAEMVSKSNQSLSPCVEVDGEMLADVEIAPYNNEDELVNLLSFYNPDIRFLGSDYNTPEMKKKITGRFLCKETYYISRFHNYSSSGMRTKIYEEEKYKEDTKKKVLV